MTEAEFDHIVKRRCELIISSLSVKGKEYRRNNNPFHNFDQGSLITGESPAKVLDGFLMKHLISYRDILNDIEDGKLPTEEVINEKLGDIINYFVIQEALIKSLLHLKLDNESNVTNKIQNDWYEGVDG